MEQIMDEQGQVSRSPETLAVLGKYVEQCLGPQVSEISLQEQEWSASGGVYMTGTWWATETPVLIKLGMNMNQLYWTQQMAVAAPDLIPALHASGEHLGELSIRWTVMERIAFGPLGPEWNGHEFAMLLDAAVRFQRAARRIEPLHIERMDASLLRRRLQVGVSTAPPGPVEDIMDRLEDYFKKMIIPDPNLL